MSSKILKITSLIFLGVFVLFIGGNLKGQEVNKQSKGNLRPNFVIIMADDLDSGQLSCYGGENINTKNIDELANQGMKFNNMICSEAMCVPTRASLFTGRYPMSHGAFQNHKNVLLAEAGNPFSQHDFYQRRVHNEISVPKITSKLSFWGGSFHPVLLQNN